MAQRDDYVAFLLTCVGWGYKVDQYRCTGQNRTADCSGLVVLGMNHVGLPEPCTVAESIAAAMVTAKTTMTIAQARATKGALLEVEFTPTHHHIATSLGDGRTVEAYDTAEGVIIGHVDGRPWSVCGRPPGMTGFDQPPEPNPGPQTPQEARDMGMTAAIMVPGAHPQGKPPWQGREPFVGAILQPNLTTDLVGFNGASITGGVAYMGMSVRSLGVLHAAIESFSAVDGNTIVGLAGDGGTFQVDVKVTYI